MHNVENRPEMNDVCIKIVLAAYEANAFSKKQFRKIKNSILKREKSSLVPRKPEIFEAYRALINSGKIKKNLNFEDTIRKKNIRTLSGIANVTVLTRFFGCPGKCIFCPTEKGMPKSYLSNEPAVSRGARNHFDGYLQVKERIESLYKQGHNITKIDIRIAGGTWGALPLWYQELFIKSIYLALNNGIDNDTVYSKEDIENMSLEDLIHQNETAYCRCVGLWVETRPDWVNAEEIVRLRRYGVTGIELGIQTTNDTVNEFNKRGHTLDDSIVATEICRNAGLKVCHHLMPNLPTATIESDRRSGLDLFRLEGLRPDYLKIYPCMVVPYSELQRMVENGEYTHRAYTDEQLISLISLIRSNVPRYCRVIRIIRDIPAQSILIGSKKSNLRQEVDKFDNTDCQCIRCREIRNSVVKNVSLNVKKYETITGSECFISLDESNLDKIVGFCRLRLPKILSTILLEELVDAAIIRELHVYGKTENVDQNTNDSNSQHRGFGKKLIKKAEEIAKNAGYTKIAIISAVGTREYYRKLGYILEGTYMVKNFK